MIIGIGNHKRIIPISYIHYDSMDMATTENEKRFLEYEKWLFNNGTNVSIEKILERKESLFPIKEKQKQL